ncbi:hypothetical protein OG943_16060 [Amycolatopsis sp. NBC_00345]|uniref:hypothetical protein n=1 Tax=Amycolatopsis sp. NBC_00345 TaxID=2975955 RepID=UPI002E25DA2B
MIQNIASVITTVSVFLAMLSLRASQQQRRRQFETLYVQRYWALMDKLSLDALRGVPMRDVGEDDERVMRAYVRLCEDQLELREKGWIGDSTWQIWAEGMRAQLQRWPFATVWKEMQQVPGEFRLLRLLLERDAVWDPCTLSWARRRLAGVTGPRTI